MQPRLRGRRAERLRIDASVSRAYREVSTDPETLEVFDALHRAARSRSLLLTPDRRPYPWDAVDALRNLAREHGAFVRSIEAWSPEAREPLPWVHSLAQHLLARYPVPRGLSRVWFGPNEGPLSRWRKALIQHGMGVPLRRALPELEITRRVEHHMLSSPDHLMPDATLRWAEVLALGGSKKLASSVAGIRMGRAGEHARFWRRVVQFFVDNEGLLTVNQMGQVVGFIDELRHRPRVVEGPLGRRIEPPLQPDFEIQGRTVRSMERLMADWGQTLAERRGATRSWSASGLEAYVYQASDSGPEWVWVELLDSASLVDEGRRMRHCIGSYSQLCRSGVCSIWSLRRNLPDGTQRSAITVEVDLEDARIRDVRSACNRDPSGLPKHLLIQWAKHNSLTLPWFLRRERPGPCGANDGQEGGEA